MAKYSKKIVENICSLVRKDSYTIAEICEKVGISKVTYHDWVLKKPYFSNSIKRAKDEFRETKLVEASRSLDKLINGFTVDEIKTTTTDTGKKNAEGKPIVKVKEHTVTKKYYPPSLGAIIHFQTNQDPDNWKNKQNTELSGKVTVKSELENLSNDELQKIIDGNR